MRGNSRHHLGYTFGCQRTDNWCGLLKTPWLPRAFGCKTLLLHVRKRAIHSLDSFGFHLSRITLQLVLPCFWIDILSFVHTRFRVAIGVRSSRARLIVDLVVEHILSRTNPFQHALSSSQTKCLHFCTRCHQSDNRSFDPNGTGKH